MGWRESLVHNTWQYGMEREPCSQHMAVWDGEPCSQHMAVWDGERALFTTHGSMGWRESLACSQHRLYRYMYVYLRILNVTLEDNCHIVVTFGEIDFLTES